MVPFTLRRHLGGSYLDLLQFFLNHRRFIRSRRAERNGKSPRELMTGQGHPHWLTLLARLSQLAPNDPPGRRFTVVGSCKVGTTGAAVIAISECHPT